MPAPAYSTPRRPDRPTIGGAVAAVASALGTPLMPWQRHVADIAGETVDGRPAHRLVVLTVPRQAGKTTLLRAYAVARCIMLPGHRAWYTAQTRQDARDRFGDLLEAVQASTMSRRVQVRLSNGSETLRFPNRSTVRLFAPKPQALHGNPADLVVFDEAWAWSADQGAAFMQAAVPTGNTRPMRQIWLVSTAGDATSQWLRDHVDRGRAADPGIAYFEWSAASGDMADIVAAHPALGHTTDDAAIADAAAAMTAGEFERAYGNRWTASSERIWPAEVWAAVRGDARPPDGATISVDVAPDQTSACIAAAWTSDTIHHAAVAAHGAGTSWVPDALAALHARHGTPVVYDEGSAAAAVVDRCHPDIRRRALRFKDAAHAAQQLYDAVLHRSVVLVADPALDAAADGAARRDYGDQWVWSRRTSAGDITPLTAVTFALWAHTHHAAAPVLVV